MNETEEASKLYRIPSLMLEQFSKEALKNVYARSHLETLALVVGKKEGNEIIATELIFPAQDCQFNSVNDKGMYLTNLTKYKNIFKEKSY